MGLFFRHSLFVMAMISTSLGWANSDRDFQIHQEYTSTRALGMGNAFVAVVDDHSALFYNPAALASRNDTQLRMFLRAGADQDVIHFYNQLKDAKNDPQATNSVIENNYQDHLYFRAPTLGAVLVRPHWGLAILPVDFDVDMSLHRSVAASVFVSAYLDSTVAWGYGTTIKVPWFNQKKYPVAVGATVKVLHRAYYSDVIQSAELATGQSLVSLSNAQEGATADVDLGALYTMDVAADAKIKPTFGLMLRNALDEGFPIKTKFINKDASAPPRLQRRLDVGTKLGLPTFWVFDPKLAIDMRDIGYDSWTPMKGLHAGAELYWKMRNWWKGHWSVGMNQGYWTAGFGARLAVFQLDIASWGEEVGTTDAKHESRRYILETSLDF